MSFSKSKTDTLKTVLFFVNTFAERSFELINSQVCVQTMVQFTFLFFSALSIPKIPIPSTFIPDQTKRKKVLSLVFVH